MNPYELEAWTYDPLLRFGGAGLQAGIGLLLLGLAVFLATRGFRGAFLMAAGAALWGLAEIVAAGFGAAGDVAMGPLLSSLGTMWFLVKRALSCACTWVPIALGIIGLGLALSPAKSE